MRRELQALCAATILALSIVGPGALAVAGDDGPPHAVRPDRPTRTILRPTEIPDLDPAFVARSSDRPVCLLVLTFCVLPALLVVFLGPPLLALLD